MSGDIASVCRANSQSAASPSPTSGAGRLRGAFRLFSSHPWRPEVPLVLGGPESQFLGMPWVCRGTKICRRKISGQRPIGAPPPQSSPRPALEGLCRGVCSVYIYIYSSWKRFRKVFWGLCRGVCNVLYTAPALARMISITAFCMIS